MTGMDWDGHWDEPGQWRCLSGAGSYVGGVAWGGCGGAGGSGAEEIQEDTSNVADWHKLPPSSGGLLYHFHQLVSKFDLGCEVHEHVQGGKVDLDHAWDRPRIR